IVAAMLYSLADREEGNVSGALSVKGECARFIRAIGWGLL
ncbi:MAG: hypothetical protein JWL77_1672, partial [Chthonomonadaceae bacterium]|nr:hypothetical protein [Chthonomonadaceae bacterium]